mgnify:CR=1 FL=1
MELGTKIKSLRLQCGFTQEELADRCELTKGYISQLENDLTSPSIATLVDLLNALGTDLKEFFNDVDDEKVVFNEDDFIVKEDERYTQTWLVPNAQKNEMEPILITLKPHAKLDEDRPHEGEEFGYILEGEIILHLGKKHIKVTTGNSFYYEAAKVHYIENISDKIAKIIWVSSPPTF